MSSTMSGESTSDDSEDTERLRERLLTRAPAGREGPSPGKDGLRRRRRPVVMATGTLCEEFTVVAIATNSDKITVGYFRIFPIVLLLHCQKPMVLSSSCWPNGISIFELLHVIFLVLIGKCEVWHRIGLCKPLPL